MHLRVYIFTLDYWLNLKLIPSSTGFTPFSLAELWLGKKMLSSALRTRSTLLVILSNAQFRSALPQEHSRTLLESSGAERAAFFLC